MAAYKPNVRVKPRSFTITESDYSTIKWLASTHECSYSEAVRTAVRVYASLLAYADQRNVIGRLP